MSPKLLNKLRRLVYNNLDLSNSRSRHFSFIVKRNTIYSFGYNTIFKTHPLANKFGHRFPDVHSELAAIKNFRRPVVELKNFKLVNIRVLRKNNLFGMSRPCPACYKLLLAFGVRNVIFSDEKGEFQEVDFSL